MFAKNTSSLSAFLILFTVLAWSNPGQAQSSGDTNNRLNRMENEIETLSRAIYRGEEPPPGAFSGGADAAATEVRLQQLETEIRNLTGRLEEQNYKIDQLQQALDRQVSDMQMQIQDNQRSAAPAPTTAAPRYTAGSGSGNGASYTAQSGTQNEEQLGSYTQSPETSGVTGGADAAAASYENAFALLKAANYDAAEVEFKSFLDQYPDHVLSPNAKYWYGETFYVRGQYEHAARIFADAYQSDPKGSKSGDNLLKLGLSLAGMGNQNDACVALRQLGKDGQPGSPVMRRAEQEMGRLGC
jgi:tol-pal system protein YbgF